MRLKTIILVSLSILWMGFTFAQDKTDSPSIVLHAFIEDGDTIPIVYMPSIMIVADGSRSKEYMRRYARMKRKIIKVYPYASMAAKLMDEYEDDLANMDREKDKKKYVKKAEKQLKKDFKGILKDMTVSEGKILIKLIDRETRKTSYQLVDELRGSASAFMWQGVAKFFGSNLKDQYDPTGEDYLMETIVRRIERGEIGLTAQN